MHALKALIPAPLKKAMKGARKTQARKQFEREAVRLDKASLVQGLRAAGLGSGDALFIHSSLKGLGYIEGGAMTVIEAFQEVVGSEGTLVFPTFTIDNSMATTLGNTDRVFDAAESASTVGAITNTFRQVPGVHRSVHPTHSVAAWGGDAEWLTKDHHTASSNFGKDTPFGRFLDINGKIVGLGISFGPVTFYHVVEDLHPELFPGVYLAEHFTTRVRNKDRNEGTMSTRCHDPAYHAHRIDKDVDIERYWSDHLLKGGIARRSAIGQGNVWWMRAADLVREQLDLQRQDISIYRVPEAPR